MKMLFGWKPFILWSLHVNDMYKLFLGKGCPSGQYIKMNECGNQFLFQVKYPSEF